MSYAHRIPNLAPSGVFQMVPFAFGQEGEVETEEGGEVVAVVDFLVVVGFVLDAEVDLTATGVYGVEESFHLVSSQRCTHQSQNERSPCSPIEKQHRCVDVRATAIAVAYCIRPSMT